MRILLTLAAAALVGCSDLYPRACTAVGCSPGLFVLFDSTPTGAVHVEALAEGETTPKTFDCTGTACSLGAVFDFTPAHVVVTVTTDAGSEEFDLRPQYTALRPNGRGCEPVCMQGRVTVSLP